jgi:medium-chain acyl-[acyl-carrier-protein] hydrolase
MVEFEKSCKIPVYDTDFRGRLYLHSLLNYIQDIASEHAELLSFGRDDLHRSNQFWILSRIYVSIVRMPEWGEEIVLKTWPRGTEGLFALRDIVISDARGEKIAGATTSWVVVDITTRRPCRPGSLLQGLNHEFPSAMALERNAGKLEPVEAGEPGRYQIAVKPSDLDVNLHVNNVKYVQWVYDSMALKFLKENDPRSVEVNFLAESVDGDKMEIRTAGHRNENNCLHHSVIRQDDSRELCRILICWNPVANEKVL